MKITLDSVMIESLVPMSLIVLIHSTAADLRFSGSMGRGSPDMGQTTWLNCGLIRESAFVFVWFSLSYLTFIVMTLEPHITRWGIRRTSDACIKIFCFWQTVSLLLLNNLMFLFGLKFSFNFGNKLLSNKIIFKATKIWCNEVFFRQITFWTNIFKINTN